MFEEILHFQKKSTELQQINLSVVKQAGVQLWFKRDDLISPYLSGNKWRKLKYNLLEAKMKGHHTLLTFGGAYSNHIFSVAAAGKQFGFRTIGVVRGEEHLPLNTTLAYAQQCGMKLHYMDRSTYRTKHLPEVIAPLTAQFGEFYLLPEGGTNALAVKGSAEIVDEITEFDYICCACGTGGTLAGIISGLKAWQHAIGFSALKGGIFLEKEISQWIPASVKKEQWQIETDYHFGGYAKQTPELASFINSFEQDTGILLDQVYTSKMTFGLLDLIRKNTFPKGAQIIAIHTGGLQLQHPAFFKKTL